MNNESWINIGVRCWVNAGEGRDKKVAFKRAEIISEVTESITSTSALKSLQKFVKIAFVNKDEKRIPGDGSIKEVPCESITIRSTASIDFEDMVRMSVMNEPELIQNLQSRYTNNNIFTYIGPTLIVINPYKQLDHLFEASQIQSIKQTLFQNPTSFSLEMQAPHVYAISALAYKNLFQTGKKQAIVISGESGAGKTENARYAMRFLTQLNHNQRGRSFANKDEQANDLPNIEERILSCNPVLEAFGNAKTVRNDNSSRFGKYVKICVNITEERITGAAITKYLLEKSRVIHISEGERNYHIFYQLLASNNKTILGPARLTSKSFQDFHYLQPKTPSNADDLSKSDSQLFQEIIDSFNVMQLEETLINAIFSTLSVILYLGNIHFSENTSNLDSPCEITPSSQEPLEIVSGLLKIDQEVLKHALLFKTRILPGGEKIHSPCTKNVCTHNRDALSKSMYDNLFNWLVTELNRGIKPPSPESPEQSSCLTTSQSISSIGLLDIFGFENFAENSFEQMCINYTNEHLQQLYISYVFKNEERIFKEDGLQDFLSNLRYDDNASTLELFDGTMGIYNLLNSVCQLQKNDDQFLSELHRVIIQQQNNKIIEFPKNLKDFFKIHHTQSDVVYKVKAFTDKNVDALSDSLKDAISSSSNHHVKSIFFVEEQNTTSKQQQQTANNQQVASRFLGAKFKKQMKDLMDELRTSDAHFIRCVKPNEEKRKEFFVEGYVLQQIQYLGVLNSIEIRKNTYPQRRSYIEFFKDYRVCDDKAEKIPLASIKSAQDECKNLLQSIKLPYSTMDVLFGNRQIYMKLDFENSLNQIRNKETSRKRLQHVLRIQRYYRYILRHRRFLLKIQKIRQALLTFRSIIQQKLFDLQLFSFSKIILKSQTINIKLKFNSIQLLLNKYLLRSGFSNLKKLVPFIQEQDPKQIDSTFQNQTLSEVRKGNESQLEEQKEHDTICVSSPSDYTPETVRQIPQINGEAVINSQGDSLNMHQYITSRDMTSIIFPDKNPNEIFVQPPNSNEHDDPLLVYVLSSRMDQVHKDRLNTNSISTAFDKQYHMSNINSESLKLIADHNYTTFYENKLNIRRKFFGKKSTKDILTSKQTKIHGGSLLPLSPKEISYALSHFEELLQFTKETNTASVSLSGHYSTNSNHTSLDGQEHRIKTLLKYSQNQLPAFKNEILTQILKQLNTNRNELHTLRLLRYLIVFCYCYKPEELYTLAMLNFLLHDLIHQWKVSQTITSYIEYIVPTLFRSISYPEERTQLYNKIILSEIKINALIFSTQIKVAITLATGVYFYVDVDPWDNFSNLKLKTMRQLNINEERLVPELFQFFEVQTRDFEIFEKLLFPLEGVWDVIQAQDIQKRLINDYDSKNYIGTPSKPTMFQFMFKPMFIFTVFPDDIVAINILQSQIYFDIYIQKVVIKEQTTTIQMLAHLMNIIPTSDVSQIVPLHYSDKDIQAIEEKVKQEYNKNIKSKFSRLQSQYEYIQLAKSNKNLLGLQLKVRYCMNQDPFSTDYTLQLNPSQMILIDNQTSKEVKSYKFSDITHWTESNDKFFIIQTKDHNKHILGTPFYQNIKFYIYLASELIRKQDEIFFNTVQSIYSTRSTSKSPPLLPNSIKDHKQLIQFQSLLKQS